jgi:hypothetical protein
MRRTGHVARTGEVRNTDNVSVVISRSIWGIILERILGNLGRKVWTGFTGSGYGSVAGLREQGNEASGSIGGEFRD